MQRNRVILYNIKGNYMAKNILKKGEAPDQYQTELYDRITKIETQILERIQKLKTNNKTFLCQHFNIETSECQPYDPNVNYYDKFWKRFLLNQIGKQNVLQFKESQHIFSKKMQKIDNLFQEWESQVQPIARAKRRQSKMQQSEQQICPYCKRTYRDQQTLTIHMKIKHGQTQNTILKVQAGHSDIFESQSSEE